MILTAVLLLTACASALAAEGSPQKLNTYYSLAIGYIGREEYDKAMEHIDAALAICSEETDKDICADLHLKKGCVYTIRQAYDDAVKELDEAIRISPELAEAYLVKVQVYTETNNTTEVIPNLEKYIELSGDMSMNDTLARLYLLQENREQAEASYRKLAESTSEDPKEVTYNLAIYEMTADMYEEALKNFKQLTSDPVKAPGLHYNSGVCNMMLGNFEEAEADFDASVEKEGYLLDATYNRAVCRMTLKKFQEAIEDFTAYIDGMLAQAAEEPAAEETAAEPAAEDAAAETEAPSEGETAETPAADGTAASIDIAYYYRGICYLSIEGYENAIADFSVCIDHGTNVNESTFNRGVGYLQTGRFDEARTDLTACIEQDYMADDALYYRSFTFSYQEDYEAALQDLNTCIEHEYNLGQTYQQRAAVYQAIGNEELYLADLEASLQYLD
jgi:tetratricopeptide (TPR) repeat protein